MPGYLVEVLLALSGAWGGLLCLWCGDLQSRETDDDSPRTTLDRPFVFAGLIAVTAITGLATASLNVLVLWLCFAAFLGVTVQLARRIPDPAPIISDQFELPPPVLWVRCRAAAGASLLCFTIGLGVIVALSGRLNLAEITEALQPILHPAHTIGRPSLRLFALRAAVISVLVGTGLTTFTSPLHFAALEALQQWPAAIAGWWATTARLLGLMIVWRIMQATSSGLESVLIPVLLGLAILSLVHGAASLWQDVSLRGFAARVLVVHAGLNWLAIAAAIAKPVAASGAVLPFGEASQWLIGSWCASSLALLVLLSAEQSLCAAPQRIDSFDQLKGLKQHHPLATLCLLIGGLSFVIAPPLPEFWALLTLTLSVLTPGTAIYEHARLMPHPAIVLGLVIAVLSLLATTVRAATLLSPLVFEEALGSRHLTRQRGVLVVVVIGSGALLLAGLRPDWWLLGSVR